MPQASKEEPIKCPVCEFLNKTKDSETIQHLKNARREILLAVKSMIEAGLTHLDVEEKPATKAKKVKVT